MGKRPSVRQQAVQRAAEIVGGPVKLARRLRVPMDSLVRWMNGTEQPVNPSFLQCVDIILDNEDSIDGSLLQDAARAADEAKRDPEEP